MQQLAKSFAYSLHTRPPLLPLTIFTNNKDQKEKYDFFIFLAWHPREVILIAGMARYDDDDDAAAAADDYAADYEVFLESIESLPPQQRRSWLNCNRQNTIKV